MKIHKNTGAGHRNAVTKFQPVTIQGKVPGVKGLEFGVYTIAVGKQDGFGSQGHKESTIHNLRNSFLQIIMLPRFLLGSYIVHNTFWLARMMLWAVGQVTAQ